MILLLLSVLSFMFENKDIIFIHNQKYFSLHVKSILLNFLLYTYIEN